MNVVLAVDNADSPPWKMLSAIVRRSHCAELCITQPAHSCHTVRAYLARELLPIYTSFSDRRRAMKLGNAAAESQQLADQTPEDGASGTPSRTNRLSLSGDGENQCVLCDGYQPTGARTRR